MLGRLDQSICETILFEWLWIFTVFVMLEQQLVFLSIYVRTVNVRINLYVGIVNVRIYLIPELHPMFKSGKYSCCLVQSIYLIQVGCLNQSKCWNNNNHLNLSKSCNYWKHSCCLDRSTCLIQSKFGSIYVWLSQMLKTI